MKINERAKQTGHFMRQNFESHRTMAAEMSLAGFPLSANAWSAS